MTTEIETKVLTAYDHAIAAGIGALMPQLDESFASTPMTEDYFARNFLNADRAILVALHAGNVIGTAVMNTLVEQAPEAETGYMGGFVVDAHSQGSGAAPALWEKMREWCRERNLPSFCFNTETYRGRAIGFYRKMGAQLVEGTDTHYIMSVKDTDK